MKEFSEAINKNPKEGLVVGYLDLYHKNSEKQAIYTQLGNKAFLDIHDPELIEQIVLNMP